MNPRPYPPDPPWNLVPLWRKVAGLLWWLTLWPTDEQVCRFMFGEHWPR